MKPALLIALTCALLFLTACSTDVDRTVTGSLSDRSERLQADNSPFESHTFRFSQGQRVQINMDSEEFDTYLLVIHNEETVQQNDDCPTPAGTLNSCLDFTVASSGVYHVVANSFDDSGRGSYTLRVQASTPE